ncbi:MAG: DUF5615 family PIN-like protein [Ignavibacteriae bacterium]|nr:DUF5615 family PIN-like protein [Ignavibacteriota bacterium]
MIILLDECIPLPVKEFLSTKGYHAEHVRETDLAGMKNGELYERAKERCQVFITNDRHFRHPLLFPATASMGILYLRITFRDDDADSRRQSQRSC